MPIGLGIGGGAAGGGGPKTTNLIMFAGQSNLGEGPGQENYLCQTLAPAVNGVPFTAVNLAQMLASNNTDPIPWMGPYTTGPIAPYVTTLANDQFGAELPLARYLQRSAPATNRWAIGKYGVASSVLATQWLPGGSYPSAGPPLFSQFIAYCQAQEAALNATLKVIIWIQAQDGLTSSYASAYAANLQTWWTAVQVVYPNALLIVTESSINSGLTFNTTLRSQQATFVAGATNCAPLMNVDALPMVNATGTNYTLTGTGVHFTASSLITLGAMLGKQVLSLLSLNALPSASFTLAPSSNTVAFADTSTDLDGSVAGWYWNFGDGNTSASQSPTHTYASSGPYTASLVVADNLGGKSSPYSQVVLPGWTVDASSGIGFPSNSTEWTAFSTKLGSGAVNPSNCWPMQDASGNAVDHVGSNNAGENSTLPTYQQAISGWTRVGILLADGATTSFQYTGTPDAGSNDGLYLALVSYASAPATTRTLMSWGGIDVRMSTVGTLEVVHSANIGYGQVVMTGTGVFPIIFRSDITNGVQTIYTQSEIIQCPYVANASTTLSWGHGGALAGAATYAGAAFWVGGAALPMMSDTTIRSLLQLLGWNVTW
jgi:PKD repeat protein